MGPIQLPGWVLRGNRKRALREETKRELLEALMGMDIYDELSGNE